MLVRVERNHVALDPDLNGNDLAFETAFRDRLCCTLLAFQRKAVLRIAADVMFSGDIFSRDTHVAGAEGAVQRAQHHVQSADVTHLGAPALIGHDIGRPAHAFGATRQRELCITQHQRLHSRNDGLRTRAAQTVHVHGGRRVGHTGLHRSDPAEIHVARFGVDDMAEHDVTDLCAFHARPLQRSLGDRCAKINGRGCRERSAECSDCCPCAVEDYDIVCHQGLPCSVVRTMSQPNRTVSRNVPSVGERIRRKLRPFEHFDFALREGNRNAVFLKRVP